MMRSNEEQLELFADLIEPTSEILGDEEITNVLRGGGKKSTAVKLAFKNHKGAVIELLARLDGEDPATYRVPGPAALVGKLITFLNDLELTELFTSQAQKTDAAAFGSAMGSTEGGAN